MGEKGNRRRNLVNKNEQFYYFRVFSGFDRLSDGIYLFRLFQVWAETVKWNVREMLRRALNRVQRDGDPRKYKYVI